MKISHIVTNGCSFTYCQGLPNMIVDGWPAQVAFEFDCPVVNLGIPGVGNDSICRRTYEYIYENQNKDQYKPLVIIEWTQRWRRECWSTREEDYIIISYPEGSGKVLNFNQKALLESWSDEDFVRRTSYYKLFLINLFENLEIPYIMFNYAGNEESIDKKNKVVETFPNMMEKTNSQFHIGDLHCLTGPLPKLPCGHDGIEGQNLLSNIIVEKIKELHPNLEFIKNSKFLTLREYIQTSKYHRKFPEWCDFKLKSDILP